MSTINTPLPPLAAEQQDHGAGCPLVCAAGRAISRATWNPYVVGIGIGVVSWLAFGWADKGIGMSTQIAAASALPAYPVMGSEGVAANPYWAKYSLSLNYSMMFLIATGIGAALSAWLSKSWKPQLMHPVWTARFGQARWKRLLAAFVGGFIILFGARMAGGCTSGHGITGTLQFAASSWIFFLVMFPAGIITARLLLGRSGGQTTTGALS